MENFKPSFYVSVKLDTNHGNNEPYFSNKSTSLGQQKSPTNLQGEKLFMGFCEDEFYMKPNK